VLTGVIGVGFWIRRTVETARREASDLDATSGEAEFESVVERRRSRACYSPADIRVWWPHPPLRGRYAGR
jgi:hypothetical protein